MLSTKVLSKLQTLSKPWFALTAWMFYYILGALIVFMLNPFLTNYEGSPSVSQALRDVLGKGEAPIALASRWLFLVALVGFAPLVETLILQSAPVSILRRFGITAPTAGVCLAALWSACLHTVGSGQWTDFLLALPGGLVLAFTFVHWRQRGNFWDAYWTTAAVHVLVNTPVAISFFVLTA